MSDLWMILVLLGACVVLAVVVFNWWQEKKYRKDVEYRFSHTRTDVLDGASAVPANNAAKKTPAEKNTAFEDVEGWMSEPRVRNTVKVEPDFSDVPKIKSANSPQSVSKQDLNKPIADERHIQLKAEPVIPVQQLSTSDHFQESEPTLLDQNVAGEPEPAELSPATMIEPEVTPTPNVTWPVTLHASMDWIGVIDAPLGVMLVELEEMQAEVRTFPHHTSLWGQNTNSTTWLDVLAMDAAAMKNQTPLSQVVCSLQLADRGGPVDQETLARFRKSMETLARTLGLTIYWQGGYEPSQQAQSIDAFCIDVDKAVEFHMLANQGMFHATKLRGLAEACGMQLSADGRFELFNSEGQLEFSVRNYEGKPFSAEMLKSAVMTGVTFQLDIPTTPNNLQVFDHMVDLARNMANSLSASLIDVNRKPIGDLQLDKIRQQLTNISNAMAAQGVIPGSSHAKRLFS